MYVHSYSLPSPLVCLTICTTLFHVTARHYDVKLVWYWNPGNTAEMLTHTWANIFKFPPHACRRCFWIFERVHLYYTPYSYSPYLACSTRRATHSKMPISRRRTSWCCFQTFKGAPVCSLTLFTSNSFKQEMTISRLSPRGRPNVGFPCQLTARPLMYYDALWHVYQRIAEFRHTLAGDVFEYLSTCTCTVFLLSLFAMFRFFYFPPDIFVTPSVQQDMPL